MLYQVIRMALFAHLRPVKFMLPRNSAKGNTHKVLKKSLDSNVIGGQLKSLLVGISQATLVGNYPVTTMNFENQMTTKSIMVENFAAFGWKPPLESIMNFKVELHTTIFSITHKATFL